MEDPFGNLRKERERRENQARMEAEQKEIAEKIALSQYEEEKNKRSEIKRHYSGLVMDVLEHLKSALYPDCIVKDYSEDYLLLLKGTALRIMRGWKLYRWKSSDEGWENELDLVRISLLIKEDCTPVRFMCEVIDRTLKIHETIQTQGLTRDELINALNRLYSKE